MPTTKRPWLGGPGLPALVLGMLLPARAEAPDRVYEGFDYQPGFHLAGLGDDRSWAQPWQEHGDGTPTVVGPNSLTFAPLSVRGGSCVVTDREPVRLTRSLARPHGAAGTVSYFSLLMRPLEAVSGRQLEVGIAGFRVGKSGTQAVYGISHGNRFASARVEPRRGRTDFLVVRATFQREAGRLELWINPAPGEPLPAQPDASLETPALPSPSTAEIRADLRCAVDEWRMGRSWPDVGPVGEPEVAE